MSFDVLALSTESSDEQPSSSSDESKHASPTEEACTSTRAVTKKKHRKGRKKSAAMKGMAGDESFGAIANVHWRQISMDAVRKHPRFVSLPPARLTTTKVASMARAATFRQDTWRWDELHAGRLTGRHTAAALGFYSGGLASRALRVPGPLRNPMRAMEVVDHLRSNELLDLPRIFAKRDFDDEGSDNFWWKRVSGAWCLSSSNRTDPLGVTDAHDARLVWGKHQEGLGLAAALELLGDGAVVAEAGLCCAEAPSLEALAEAWDVKALCAPPPRTRNEPLKLGASPDGFVVADDGAVSILEIKSVCPFVARPDGFLALRDRGPASSLDPWIVPQLMLGIYCSGAAGAHLVSVSATRGAAFFRVERDDAYIAEMIVYLDYFYEQCVRGSRSPLDLDFADVGDYDTFLDRTRRIARAARPRRRPPVNRPDPDAPAFLDGQAR